MIKVLGLALYGTLAASTRVRLGQYAPGLREHGIDLQVSALLGNKYVSRRFQGASAPWSSMVRAGWDRLNLLYQANQFDLAMLYCELLPLVPGQIERRMISVPYIYDFDDAFYLRYRIGAKRALSGVLGKKFDHVMAGAAAITAGNSVLVKYAQQHNANVQLFPTVVDTTRYAPRTGARSNTFTVGWIGSPSTSTYLPELVEPLRLLGKEGDVEFVVVGGKAPPIPGVRVKEVTWTEASEVDLINTFDVGVMPLPDDEWARGKCAYKLIQYMACGVPVVGSAVGANCDVVTPECGFLVTSSDDWLSALRKLRDERALRDDMGEAGRQRVAEHFSLQRNLPKLAAVIHSVAGR